MADIVSPAVRSGMMARIKSKHTRPENTLRKLLHGMGFRYRLHDRRLPGSPDMVFPKYHAAIFVHGCFWHGHDCPFFKWPASNAEFWREKIHSNRARDDKNRLMLKISGWRVGIVWECALKKNGYSGKEVAQEMATWLKSNAEYLELGGGASPKTH